LNRATGAPVSDPARFKMRDIEPGRRPALQFMGRKNQLPRLGKIAGLDLRVVPEFNARND
jgi:hypothetical protein